MAVRKPVTPEQQELLDAAAEVADVRRGIDARYVEAVLAAKAAGVSNAEIARHVGASDEAVRLLLVRHGGGVQ